MWRNYFKIAFRNLWKHKVFSLINIVGLAIGIACSILIFLFVQYELSYDTFHEKSNRIYRMAVDAVAGKTVIRQTGTPAPLPGALYAEYPEIEHVTRIRNFDEAKIEIDNKKYIQKDIFIVDSSFFEMFDKTLIQGKKGKLLNEPYTAVITKSFAEKYFPDEDPINKTIHATLYYDSVYSVKVISVIEDFPHNSHFHTDILISLVTFNTIYNHTAWFWNSFSTYICLNENSDYKELEKKFPDLVRNYLLGSMSDESYEESRASGNKWDYYLQPLTDIHLNSDLNGEFEPNGNKAYVQIFIIVAMFILIIASINFMNLSTAKSANRAMEVGVRKVVGARKTSLLKQFLVESILICFISLILGMVIIESIMPFYRNFIDKPIEMQYFTNPLVLPTLILLALIIGTISGIYPGFVLSQFKPIVVLKSKLSGAGKKSWMRNVLVIFQFAIAIALISGTIIVGKQVSLIQNKNLGFSKEQVFVIHNAFLIEDKIGSFKTELLKNSNIQFVSASTTLPGTDFSNIGFGAEEMDDGFTLNLCMCDPDYINVMQLEMQQGRFFSNEFKTDSSAIIINEAALELLGYEEPLGKTLNNWSTDRDYFKLVGVVKDYHYESMHQAVRPQGLLFLGGNYSFSPQYISCRLKTDNISNTISDVSNLWDEFANGIPMEYSFLEDDYNAVYKNESQTKHLFTIFSILSVFIACLGLLGLASFIAQQKTKEIGIRKVHGATLPGIFALLSKDFTKWVVIANIVAWPFAWYLMDKWLQNFAYKIEISWWYFLIAGLAALGVAIITVSTQSLTSARMNPVDALRYE